MRAYPLLLTLLCLPLLACNLGPDRSDDDDASADDDDATPIPDFDPSDLPAGTNPVAEPLRGVVQWVADGDTFEIDVGAGQSERVRVLSVDTPELHGDDNQPECWAEHARDRTTELLPAGTTVWLTFDGEQRDMFDRLLAYVFVGELDEHPDFDASLNYLLVAEGQAYTFFFENNQTYRQELEDAEERARYEDLGVWSCP